MAFVTNIFLSRSYSSSTWKWRNSSVHVGPAYWEQTFSLAIWPATLPTAPEDPLTKTVSLDLGLPYSSNPRYAVTLKEVCKTLWIFIILLCINKNLNMTTMVVYSKKEILPIRPTLLLTQACPRCPGQENEESSPVVEHETPSVSECSKKASLPEPSRGNLKYNYFIKDS